MTIPAVSQKQQKLFGALLANPTRAKAKGISPSTAKEFATLPKGKKLKQLPKKKKQIMKKNLSNILKACDCACESPKPKFKSYDIQEAEGGWVISSWSTNDKIIATTFEDVLSALKKIDSKKIVKALTAGQAGAGKEFIATQFGGKKKKKLLSRFLDVMNQRNEQMFKEVGI